MTMAQIGKNTIAGEELRGFVERIEALDARKKEIGDERKIVMAEAAARGFVAKAIAYVVKVRAMKPHDRAESESLRDIYLHAMGLDNEPPLFRAVGLMDVDIHARASIVEAMKRFVPADGEIIIRVKGTAERLWRDKQGEVQSEPVAERPKVETATPSEASGRQRAEKAPVPDVDEEGAFALGRQAALDNQPVIANPFPFGDPRRPRFDEGWRAGSGGDGMGPGD
jgi:uncharacterized protein (UPF0335 family)